MSFFEKLLHEETVLLAALCAGATLLAGAAIFLNGADLKAITNSPSLTAASVVSLFDSGTNAAATALGDAQGVPPNYTGKTYPDLTSCWVNLMYTTYGWDGSMGPLCRGNSAQPFYSGIFSVNPVGSATGESVYANSTWVDTGFVQGPLLGPPFSTLGCPAGTTMLVTGTDPDTGETTAGECYSGVTGPVRTFAPPPAYVGPATYCYEGTSGGGGDGMGGGGGGAPAKYSFPAGYSLANGDKLDTTGNRGSDGASIFAKSGDGQCHAWKYVLQHVDSTPVPVGTVPTVAPGTPLTLQWSCLPSRVVNGWGCRPEGSSWSHPFGVSCSESSYTYNVLNISPLASSVSGNGQNFVSGTSITGTKTIAAPSSAGTYTYSLSCSGGPYPLPAMTVDVTVSGQPATPVLSLTPAISTIPYNGTQTLTYSATGGAGYDACYLSGGQWGSNPGTAVSTAGSVTTNNLTASTQYSYTCHDTFYGWVTPVSATVTVTPPQSSCPNGLNYATYGPSCTCTPPQIQSGSVCVLPSQCPGAHEVNYPTCSCEIGYVKQNGVCVIPASPTFTAVPAATLPGQAVTLTWSCPTPPYTESQGDSHYSTAGALSGNATVNPTNTTTYNLYCKFGNNQTSKSATVTVAQPNLSIIAVPTRVQKGRTATVSWSATNVTAGSCRVTGTDGASWAGASGSQTPTITASVIYTLACSVPSGPVSKSVTVGIVPIFQEI